MSQPTLSDLHFGELKVKLPIIQGGMGVGISGARLASAVANQGGIGVISAVALGVVHPEPSQSYKKGNTRALKQEIQKARQWSNGLIGVNIMVALSDYNELLETALDEDVDFLFLGAGLPLKFPESVPPERLRSMRTKIVPIVSSGKAANLILRHWSKRFGHVPDGFVVEGPKAGGHLGFKPEQIDDPRYSLSHLLSEVLETVAPFAGKYLKSIPVIVAGGVYSGEDIYDFLKQGAHGVQLGTRFVATHECDADIRFKEAYIQSRKEDLTIIQSPVGLPGRALKNDFLGDVAKGERKPFKCPWKCLKSCDYKSSPYCIAAALNQARQGHLGDGFAFAGANAWRVDRIMSVQELMDSLVQEYEHCCALHEETAVLDEVVAL